MKKKLLSSILGVLLGAALLAGCGNTPTVEPVEKITAVQQAETAASEEKEPAPAETAEPAPAETAEPAPAEVQETLQETAPEAAAAPTAE